MADKTLIDPRAVIHPSAKLAPGVTVGPFTVINEDVCIGKDTWIGPSAVIGARTTIGEECKIYQFSSVGEAPQDLAYKGEATETVIGDRNTIREFVTIHRGTVKDEGKTRCGSGILFMNYVHVAHDCVIGDNVILANAATLAGHVKVEENAIVGGLVAVHQYTRIGAHSIIGGASAVSKDILPYVTAVGNRAHVHGLNLIGLKRHGFTRDEIKEIRTSYKIILKSGLRKTEAVERLRKDFPGSKHAERLAGFLESSERGIARERSKHMADNDSEGAE